MYVLAMHIDALKFGRTTHVNFREVTGKHLLRAFEQLGGP